VGKIDPYGDPRPSYRQVADDVAARIDSGEITHRLPGERALAQEYEVAVQTVRHSMEVLRDEGRIITRQGRGSFVDPPPPSDDADSP
jgi:GntR family transcriptional regulator